MATVSGPRAALVLVVLTLQAELPAAVKALALAALTARDAPVATSAALAASAPATAVVSAAGATELSRTNSSRLVRAQADGEPTSPPAARAAPAEPQASPVAVSAIQRLGVQEQDASSAAVDVLAKGSPVGDDAGSEAVAEEPTPSAGYLTPTAVQAHIPSPAAALGEGHGGSSAATSPPTAQPPGPPVSGEARSVKGQDVPAMTAEDSLLSGEALLQAGPGGTTAERQRRVAASPPAFPVDWMVGRRWA